MESQENQNKPFTVKGNKVIILKNTKEAFDEAVKYFMRRIVKRKRKKC